MFRASIRQTLTLSQGARLTPEIAYGTIAQMSRNGVKVLHHRALEYAEQHAVAVVCKSLTSDGAVTCTIVTGHEDYGDGRSVTVARDAAVI